MEIRFVPYLLIMLAILSGLIKLLDWHDERLDTKCANLMRKDVLFEKDPEKEQLLTITRNKLFKQTTENFQKAVQTKLATYDLVPTAIEKTMSTEQLYRSGSPLWAKGLTTKAIERFYDIENQLNNYGARPNEYVGEYVEDCKNGIPHTEALQKQQRKYGIY